MSTRIPIVEMAIGQCPLSDINSSFDPLCHFCEVFAGAVCHLATHFESPPSWFGLVCPCYTPAPPHHHAAASQSQHQVESGTSSSCGKQTKVSDVTCGDVRGRWSAGLVAKLRKDGKESKYNKGWAGAWWVGVSWVPFTPRVDVSCPCCAAEDSCRQSFSESIHSRFSPINPGGSCSKASEVLLSLPHWQQLVNM